MRTQQAEKIKTGGINFDPLADVPEEVWHLIPGFLERREEDIDLLNMSLRYENFEALRSIGHRLKGTGASYGLMLISEIGALLEKQAKEKDLSGLTATVQSFSLTLGSLKEYFARR